MSLKLNSSGGGSVTLSEPVTASNTTLTLPASTGTLATTDGANTTFTSITDSGNLTFTGTGNRITGDFSNATLANRVMFQNSVANASTIVGFLPNGTGGASAIQLFNNSSDPANASYVDLRVSGTTDCRLQATYNGTGTQLPLTFYTGGSERMRIDSSGNVGIGTSSPGQKLDVNGKIKATDVVGGSASSSLSLVAASSVNVDGASITLRGTSAGYDNGGIEFYTSSSGTGSERMRIDSSGNLLLNTTTSNNVGTGAYGDAAQILKPGAGSPAFCAANSWAGGVLYVGKSVGGSGQQFIEFFQQGNSRGAITNTGTGVTYNTSSDYRLKENIQPMQGALARNQNLKPVTYTWKADGSSGEGFIAHELQEVVPSCVTGEKDAVDKDGKPVYQGIDTSFLVGHLVACINELKAEIDELKAKVQ